MLIKRTHDTVHKPTQLPLHASTAPLRGTPSCKPTPHHVSRLPVGPIAEMLPLIQHTLAARKGEDIQTVSLIGKTDIADAMVVATGTSSRHVAALAHYVTNALLAAGYVVLCTDGDANADWIVVDAGDVMIHLFDAEARQKYQLEKMWRVTFHPTEDDGSTPTSKDSAA